MVGGGISGLYCASVLSKHGHKVTVFDLGKHAPGACLCGGWLPRQQQSHDTGSSAACTIAD